MLAASACAIEGAQLTSAFVTTAQNVAITFVVFANNDRQNSVLWSQRVLWRMSDILPGNFSYDGFHHEC
jgi:hypothetical protein